MTLAVRKIKIEHWRDEIYCPEFNYSQALMHRVRNQGLLIFIQYRKI